MLNSYFSGGVLSSDNKKPFIYSEEFVPLSRELEYRVTVKPFLFQLPLSASTCGVLQFGKETQVCRILTGSLCKLRYAGICRLDSCGLATDSFSPLGHSVYLSVCCLWRLSWRLANVGINGSPWQSRLPSCSRFSFGGFYHLLFSLVSDALHGLWRAAAPSLFELLE